MLSDIYKMCDDLGRISWVIVLKVSFIFYLEDVRG